MMSFILMKFFLGYGFCLFFCLFFKVSLANEPTATANFVLENPTIDLASPDVTALKHNELSALLKTIDFTQIDYEALCSVANNTLNYIHANSNDSFAVHGGNTINIETKQALLPFSSVERIKESLTFICDTFNHDFSQ